MKRSLIIFFILLLLSEEIFSQTNGGIFRSGIVIQKWTIENLNDPISEGTFPLEVIYPLRANLNVQINHSPAFSRFGNNNLSGLSDTWIRSTYTFSDNQAVASIGLGLPTGKTELDASETNVSKLISQNALKFRLPVFGQGLTLSAGVMYAYSINAKMTIGAGVNYVLRGKYKYSKLVSDEYNPGDQFGLNLGFDYIIIPNLRSNVDFVLNYYTTDKLNNTKIFLSGAKFSTKVGFQYQVSFGYLWFRAYYRSKAKNETWNGQALVPAEKNYNITQKEFDLGAKMRLSDILSLIVGGEVRSYSENDVKKGWVDLVGGGLGYELLMSEKLAISMGFKLFFGDGEFMNTIPNFSGLEFQLGTQWKF